MGKEEWGISRVPESGNYKGDCSMGTNLCVAKTSLPQLNVGGGPGQT